MGRTYEAIDDRLRDFLLAQHVFFVATAPLSTTGHINLSPKGMRGTFAVTGASSVAYLDLTGSGVETISHIRENGRIVLMFCSFSGPPRIVRLHGTAEVIEPEDARFATLRESFETLPGSRAVIDVRVGRISDSCGYGVPLMEFASERDQLLEWATRKGPEGLERYWRDKNATSIDGLTGMAPRR
jgi:hypothetical protein